jgi:hypothetical protein
MDLRVRRRDLFRAATVVGVVAASGSVSTSVEAAIGAAATGATTPSGAGMRAFKLYTGHDNASHVLEGTIDEKARTDVVAIHLHYGRPGVTVTAPQVAEVRRGGPSSSLVVLARMGVAAAVTAVVLIALLMVFRSSKRRRSAIS